MTITTAFPHKVTEIENTWITLSDGTRLAARIWMPEDAPTNPRPAILEYLPYRKRDGTHQRDALTYPYFAGHGYVGVRVDMRGCGDSDGLMRDEYLPQEQHDALQVIDWLTRQPWCDGAVGMMGISWGGFNSLQVAAHRPPALKAIISLCSTDNRYRDDIHYKGGALLMENLGWASTMLSYSSRPPDPLLRDDWEEIWMQRLENTPLLIEKWLQHPNFDELWKHGSIDRNYAAIEAATLLIGGWHDAYSNTVARMLAHLHCPRQGIVGPWAHKYPHFATPQPRIGFLQIAVRWWDYWLKGIDNGVMAEPLLRAYLMDGVAPQPSYALRAGRWVAAHRWPSERVQTARFLLGADGLSRADDDAENRAQPQAEYRINSPADSGTSGGEFCIMWMGPDWPTDQRDDDARSLTFDSAPADQPVTLFGAAEITLALAADQPGGNIIVRLCDVAADGASTLITYGVLNLAHRGGHENPQPMEVGQRTTIRFKLDDCGYVVPRGHRLRVAVSTAHWPLLWPSAYHTTVTLYAPECHLDLPLYEHADEHASSPEFPPAVTCQPCDSQVLSAADSFRKVTRDVGKQLTQVEILNDFGASKSARHGLIKHETNHEWHTINPADPLSARSQITGTQLLARDQWKTTTETATEMWCDRRHFHLKASLTVCKNDRVVFERAWERSIPRPESALESQAITPQSGSSGLNPSL